MTDDRVWLPDLNSVLDWGAVLDAGEHRWGDKATWWTQATAGVNYYRAEMPAKHLPGKTVRFESRDLQPRADDGEPYFPRQEGAAIWMFPGNQTRAICMAEMHLQGMKVMVEVDDNYCVAPPRNLGTWQNKIDYSGEDNHSYEAHRRIVASRACHGVIVSTPKLWEVYQRFDTPVYVCPNCIDPDDWDADPPHQKDGLLRIGWAGSASHQYDLAEIVPALDWASRQRDVEVVVLGELALPVKARQVEWTDSLAQYRKNVQELDIILCPVRPGEWADCKSDVKALEGVMGGALPVVSKTEPFRAWWGRGYVAERKKDWKTILTHLVNHRDEVRDAWVEAYTYVMAERTIQDGIEAWRQALQ